MEYGNVFFFLFFNIFIVFGQLNFVWSALFLFNIYFLLLIRCSLVCARPSSSPRVQALRKRVKSLRSNDIFTFQRFFFTLLARLSVYSVSFSGSLVRSSRSVRRWFRLPIGKWKEREAEKRSLRSWQTVVASSSFSTSCFIFSITLLLFVCVSLMRLVFTIHSIQRVLFFMWWQ